eukprot:SAG31_NODE_1562_length_7871_cov_8.208312_2_plen_173_part_00
MRAASANNSCVCQMKLFASITWTIMPIELIIAIISAGVSGVSLFCWSFASFTPTFSAFNSLYPASSKGRTYGWYIVCQLLYMTMDFLKIVSTQGTDSGAANRYSLLLPLGTLNGGLSKLVYVEYYFFKRDYCRSLDFVSSMACNISVQQHAQALRHVALFAVAPLHTCANIA